jgi:hypothetical protein
MDVEEFHHNPKVAIIDLMFCFPPYVCQRNTYYNGINKSSFAIITQLKYFYAWTHSFTFVMLCP